MSAEKALSPRPTREKLIVAGRRFGKSTSVLFCLINSLPIPQEEKQRLFEIYKKIEAGEI